MRKKKFEITPNFVGRVLAWIAVIWIGVMIIVASWTTRTRVPVPPNEQFQLSSQLKAAESQTPPDFSLIQSLRAKLIIAHLNSGALVKGRQELLTYTNFLDTNKNLPLNERVEMRSQLAIIYMSLQEVESAIKQYDIIIKDLEDDPSYDLQLMRARLMNDRGVALYLRSQQYNVFNSDLASFNKERQELNSKNSELSRHYLTRSRDDFKASKELLDQLAAEKPGEKKTADMKVLFEANQKFFNEDLNFMHSKVRP
jgi:tetratricopeptide (TPR) repeat protein